MRTCARGIQTIQTRCRRIKIIALEPSRLKYRFVAGDRVEQHLRRDRTTLRVFDLFPPFGGKQDRIAIERAVNGRGVDPGLERSALEDHAVGVAEAVARAGVPLARLPDSLGVR